MTINKTKILEGLILFTLALTPVFSIGEIVSLFLGTIVNNSTNITPVYIKLVKDLLFVLMIVMAALQILDKKKVHVSFLFLFPLLAFAGISILISPANLLLIAAGIRWMLTVVLMFFLIGRVDETLYIRISKVLFRLFIVHVAIQVVQFAIMPGYFGVTIFGRSSRNPGIFFIPNTAAFFSILCLFFALYHPFSERARKITIYLVPLSIFLTASGTGLASVIVIYFVHYLKTKYTRLVFILSPIFAIPFLFLIKALSGRDIIENSLLIRVDIFNELFKNVPLVSNFFGAGTTSSFLATNLTGANNTLFSTDSTFATIVVNLGVLPFCIFLGFYTLWLIMVVYNYRNKELLVFTIIFTFFALTTSFTESFPGNFIYAILLSSYIKKYLVRPSGSLEAGSAGKNSPA